MRDCKSYEAVQKSQDLRGASVGVQGFLVMEECNVILSHAIKQHSSALERHNQNIYMFELQDFWNSWPNKD
jgi:hypothetical protein